MGFNMLETMGVFNDAPGVPEIVMLDIDRLRDSKENFYFVEDEESEKIRAKNEELKSSIEMFGVLEPLLVKPAGNDAYDIVSGHRRRFVSKRIVAEGKEAYRKLPCIIDTGKLKEEYEAEYTDEVKAALMGLKLIQLNSTAREIDGWQQTEQVKRTKEKLLILKENGVKMPGGMRNQIALLTGMSRSEVGRHEQIDKNLVDDFKEAYKSGEIVKHAAAELAAMPAEEQRAVYEQTGGKATVKDIKEYKERQAPVKSWTDMTPCEQCRSANPSCAEDHCCKACEESCNGRQECRIDHPPQERQREIDEWNQWAQEQRRKAGAGGAESKESGEPEAESEPSNEETEEEAPNKYHQIEAALYVKKLIEMKIKACAGIREYAIEQNKAEDAAQEAAKIEYMEEILKRVERDLFEMSGNDIFKTKEKV